MEKEVAKKRHEARIKELRIEVEAKFLAAVRKLEQERALAQRREAELHKLLELEQQGVQGVLRHANGPPTWTWDLMWRNLKRQLRDGAEGRWRMRQRWLCRGKMRRGQRWREFVRGSLRQRTKGNWS